MSDRPRKNESSTVSNTRGKRVSGQAQIIAINGARSKLEKHNAVNGGVFQMKHKEITPGETFCIKSGLNGSLFASRTVTAPSLGSERRSQTAPNEGHNTAEQTPKANYLLLKESAGAEGQIIQGRQGEKMTGEGNTKLRGGVRAG